MNEQISKLVLDHINQKTGEGQPRLDAATDTAAIAHIFEHIKTQTYDVLNRPMKAQQFIPVDTSADGAAEDIVYYQWDHIGMAKLIHNYAKDFPLVTALAKKFKSPVKSIGDMVQYTVIDIRRNALALRNGQALNIDTHMSFAARLAVDTLIDNIAAYGNDETGLPGFLTNPNVSILSLTHGEWISQGRSPEEILEDLTDIAIAATDAGGEVFEPDTLILPDDAFNHIQFTYMTTGVERMTILEAFLRKSTYIKNVDKWSKLGNVPGAVGGNRAVCYYRNPLVLTLEIPQPFESFPPQPEGMAFNIYNHARIGGTVIRYPFAVMYIDNVN